MSVINQIQVDNTLYDIEDSGIYDWARASVKPVYTASEVGALPSNIGSAELGTAKAYCKDISGNYYWNTATSSPSDYKIAKYDGNSYLNSTTPSAGDSSTKVATTSFVQAAFASHQTIRLSNVACNANSAVGDFATASNDAITANHVVANIVFNDPAQIRSDVTWTTTTSNLTLNGRCYAATTADIILVYNDVLVS